MAGRISGCKARFAVRPADDSGSDLVVADMTNVTIEFSADNSTFKTLNSCADQTGEGTKSFTLSGDFIFSTDDPGQSLFEEGKLLQGVIYFDPETLADSYVKGRVRIGTVSLNISPDDNISGSFSATNDGEYTKSNFWGAAAVAA